METHNNNNNNNNNNVFSGFNYDSALACETESTRHPYASYSYAPTSAPVTVNDSFLLTHQHGIASHALISNSNGRCCYSLYGGDVSPLQPDPHLVCLKLGKRNYFEDSTLLGSGGGGGGFNSIGKKDKPASSTAVVAPRCQVEGCNVALVNAKDYHRRHKVCEMHSKAPKVMVLGLEQRFCQQCSRFHVVSEFDDTKRSCRRRLAGHNERRRKTTSHDSFSRSTSLDNMTSGYQYLPSLSGCGCALSLLSPRPDSSIVSSSDLSSRSRAALHELIAEKRASNISPQLIDLDRNWQLNSNTNTNGVAQTSCNYNYATNSQQHHMFPASSSWDQRLRFHDGTGSHVTLDLMQATSSSPFGWLSMKGKTKEECSQMWNSMDGSHVI